MESYAGQVHDDKTEEQEDLWNDPNLLNNPEKLRKIKWTPSDMKLATSTDLIEKTGILTDLVLQDERLMKILEKHMQTTSIDENAAVKHLGDVSQLIFSEQANCLQIISDVKNKPFWNEKEKAKILDESQQSNVQRWVETVDQFSRTFERAQLLRASRRSILPTDNLDPEAIKIVDQLKNIYDELCSVSKIFDTL